MRESGVFYYKGQTASRLPFVAISEPLRVSLITPTAVSLKEVNDASHLRAKVVRPPYLDLYVKEMK
jgi:hypothetical protein